MKRRTAGRSSSGCLEKIIWSDDVERFEVKKDGRIWMWAEDPRAWPDKELRRDLRAAGYRLYLGGKPFKEC